MRPLVTWLVVGALAAIGLLAARDALRGDAAAQKPGTTVVHALQHAPPAGPPAIPGRGELSAELEALGATGALYVTDVNCRRFILRLPALRWTTPAGLPGPDCGFGARPVVHDGSGIAALQVDDGRIEVFSEGWRHDFAGTSPAFKPGGTLTFVRNGRLYEWSARCPAGAATVGFRGVHVIARCIRAVPGAPPLMREAVWLAEDDYAALAGSQEAASLLVVRGGRTLSVFRAVGIRLTSLRASPDGRYLAVSEAGQLALFDSRREGELRQPPGAALPRVVAWSPDERFTAAATESFVFVYPSGRSRPAVALPLSAIRLDWR